MRNIVKALAATPVGIGVLGIGYSVARSEIHYWMTPAHLPMLMTGGAVLVSMGVGGTTVWARKAIEKRKEDKRMEQILQAFGEREAVTQAQPHTQPQAAPQRQVIDLGRAN